MFFCFNAHKTEDSLFRILSSSKILTPCTVCYRNCSSLCECSKVLSLIFQMCSALSCFFFVVVVWVLILTVIVVTSQSLLPLLVWSENSARPLSFLHFLSAWVSILALACSLEYSQHDSPQTSLTHQHGWPIPQFCLIPGSAHAVFSHECLSFLSHVTCKLLLGLNQLSFPHVPAITQYHLSYL